jgi:tetratricopeptide (TPR) repeat protein
VSVANEARPEARSTDLLLARAHLRLGQYSFARAELETLAVRGEMDGDGLADLAEARWRTGELPGAGEAAQAHLDAGGDRTSAFVIAAEAAVADGRVADAQRLADRVLQGGDDLDTIFAGLPRSRVWRVAGPSDEPTDERPAEAPAGVTPDGGLTPAAAAAPTPGDAQTVVVETGSGGAHRLIAFAATALRDDRSRAAVELALVLRSEPSLAPAVLELIARAPDGGPSRSAAALEVVRGDAYRLIGRPREAEQAYARAVTLLSDYEGVAR